MLTTFKLKKMEKIEIKIIKVKDSSGYTEVNMGIYDSVGVYCSPFYNCQNFSIAGFETLLSITQRYKEFFKFFIHNFSQRRKLLMVDIKDKHADKARELFKESTIIIDHPYKSTNGSKMNLFYVELDSALFEQFDPKDIKIIIHEL